MSGTGSRIDTSGNGGGGSISVTSGSVDIRAGIVAADGGLGESCGDGGEIDLVASSGLASIAGTVRTTTAGGECDSGSIAVSGDAVSISGSLDARGGQAVGDDAIAITATSGNITLLAGATLRADGTGQPEGAGASGGEITLDAELGNVILDGQVISATGNSPDGQGGYVLVRAKHAVQARTRIVVDAGSQGLGGEAHLQAGTDLFVAANVEAKGGFSFPAGSGGIVTLDAQRSIVATSALDVSASNAGRIGIGSSDETTAGPAITLSGSALAKGARGDGGLVDVVGCTAQVDGILDSGSNNGGIAGSVGIRAGTVKVLGTAQLRAAACANSDCVSIRTPDATADIAPAATINPAAVLIADASIRGCPPPADP
jgi:hypothetical protein